MVPTRGILRLRMTAEARHDYRRLAQPGKRSHQSAPREMRDRPAKRAALGAGALRRRHPQRDVLPGRDQVAGQKWFAHALRLSFHRLGWRLCRIGAGAAVSGGRRSGEGASRAGQGRPAVLVVAAQERTLSVSGGREGRVVRRQHAAAQPDRDLLRPVSGRRAGVVPDCPAAPDRHGDGARFQPMDGVVPVGVVDIRNRDAVSDPGEHLGLLVQRRAAAVCASIRRASRSASSACWFRRC